MSGYREAYLELLRAAAERTSLVSQAADAQGALEAIRAQSRRVRARSDAGTELLRGELFPTLDDVMSAPEAELEALRAFAERMASGPAADVCLSYRIHLALMSYARQTRRRDMLIRELYQLGMALFNLETMLSPNRVRLYSARMRMYFAEAASYFETEYDAIEDPEIRGYIHRSMGNIALSYEGTDPAVAHAKLAAIERSIRVLSDPDVQAKTPSLPWDLYLYKSHQERTSMLSYLRSGYAEAEVFAQVLESAQIVQQRQTRAARERGEPLQPRWQYAYYAARYHCGAMLLPELLDGLNALSSAQPDDDYSYQGLFSHVSVPALFMEYSKELTDEHELRRLAPQLQHMQGRMFAWLSRMPEDGGDTSFALRQFLYAFRELPGCMRFPEAAQNVFAALRPDRYVQMWSTGRLARQLCEWAIEDCPERLTGLFDCAEAEEVVRRREALLDFAGMAGRLCDTGMVHFLNIDANSCRGLFEEEQALMQMHAYCGSELLACHESTALCADVAHGHHCHYDERGGYPLGFSPQGSPVRAMIYLVAAASAIVARLREADASGVPDAGFDAAIADFLAGEGTRFAPFVTRLLRAPGRVEQLRGALALWAQQASQDLLSRAG